MRKRNFPRSILLYLVFLSNTVYAVLNGFDWLYWVTAALTLCMLVLDIMEVIRRGRK